VRPPKQTKRETGTVGEGVYQQGAVCKKDKTTQHSGGQSVSEKSQATRTSKNVDLCSGLIGLVSCGAEHHTGDY
jgi:hypothetical protein